MSAGENTYNGWANYPTWAINLWLSNDEGLYNEVRDRAREILDNLDADESERDNASWSLENYLREELCEIGGDYGLIPELEGFAADLMVWALGMVDWHEIATAWIDEIREGER